MNAIQINYKQMILFGYFDADKSQTFLIEAHSEDPD